jgi:hypothetical protein
LKGNISWQVTSLREGTYLPYLERRFALRKFFGVIAVTLILLSLFSSSSVMAAEQCSNCKKYNTRETYDELNYGVTEYFCYRHVIMLP